MGISFAVKSAYIIVFVYTKLSEFTFERNEQFMALLIFI